MPLLVASDAPLTSKRHTYVYIHIYAYIYIYIYTSNPKCVALYTYIYRTQAIEYWKLFLNLDLRVGAALYTMLKIQINMNPPGIFIILMGPKWQGYFQSLKTDHSYIQGNLVINISQCLSTISIIYFCLHIVFKVSLWWQISRNADQLRLIIYATKSTANYINRRWN